MRAVIAYAYRKPIEVSQPDEKLTRKVKINLGNNGRDFTEIVTQKNITRIP